MPKTTRILYIYLPDNIKHKSKILPSRLINKVCMKPPIDFPKSFRKGVVHRIEVPKELTEDKDIFNYIKVYNLIYT